MWKFPKIKFPKINWDRKASPIAVIAFVISITQVGIQVYSRLARPKIEVILPDAVTFVADFNLDEMRTLSFTDKEQNVNTVKIALIAPLAYYHAGRSSANAVLVYQIARITVGKRTVRWVGKQWGHLERPEKGKWGFVGNESLPIVIRPGEAVRNEVFFEAPFFVTATQHVRAMQDNYLTWSEFLSMIDTAEKLTVTIESEFANHDRVSTQFDLHLRSKYANNPYWMNVCDFNVVGSPAERAVDTSERP